MEYSTGETCMFQEGNFAVANYDAVSGALFL